MKTFPEIEVETHDQNQQRLRRAGPQQRLLENASVMVMSVPFRS
jgi:hypothetical protein